MSVRVSLKLGTVLRLRSKSRVVTSEKWIQPLLENVHSYSHLYIHCMQVGLIPESVSLFSQVLFSNTLMFYSILPSCCGIGSVTGLWAA